MARAAFAGLAAALASVTLSGCIAAAIPLVAGGAMARSNMGKDDIAQTRPAPNQPEIETPSEADRVADLAPANQAPTVSAVESSSVLQSPQMSEFIRYSTEHAFQYSASAESLPSAVLSKPSSLDGERLQCDPEAGLKPSILIDLDPGETPFARGSDLPTSAAIALSLTVLRSEGVEIAWISENSAADADIVRDALSASGLDPNAEDTLLLMRYPDDRKQTRRKEFAAQTCLIAIAGDRRNDFDELYDFLTSRDAAFRLETMINDGWFLIPSETSDLPPDQPPLTGAQETANADITQDGKLDE